MYTQEMLMLGKEWSTPKLSVLTQDKKQEIFLFLKAVFPVMESLESK
jgi:hypothetical protein